MSPDARALDAGATSLTRQPTLPPAGSRWAGALRSEWGKACSVWVPALWLLCSAVVCVVTGTTLANDFLHSTTTGELPPQARMPLTDALGPALATAQVAVAAFGTHLITPEFASRSILVTYATQPRRPVVLLAKVVVAGICAALLGAVMGPVVGFGARTLLASHEAGSASLVVVAAATSVVFAASAVMGVALGTLTRNAVVSLCLSLVLLVATLALPERVAGAFPGVAVSDLLTGLVRGDGWLGPLCVVSAWAAALVMAGVAVDSRRDA